MGRSTAKDQRNSPFDWDVHVSNVMQDEVDQLLIVLFAYHFDEGLRL